MCILKAGVIILIAIIWVVLEFIGAFIAVISVMFASFCSKFGDYHTTDYKEYGDWYNYKIPAFLPESLDGYLNETSSNCVYEYRVAFLFDVVSEIFLDVTLDEETFNEKITEFKSLDGVLYEQPAYYDENFVEIVFDDHYQSFSEENRVGWADIEKIIYNESACEIINV